MKDEIGITTLVNQYFSFLKVNHGFVLSGQEIHNSDYRIVMTSPDLVIKLEKYRRELYCYISRLDDPESEVHLFNLLRYLSSGNISESSLQYFSHIEDATESLTLQLKLISGKIQDNYLSIAEFFEKENYKSNLSKLNAFVMKQNPNLFKT